MKPTYLVSVIVLALSLRAGAEEPPPVTVDSPTLKKAIAKGVEYLLNTQKADGSWGTPAPTFVCDVWSPMPSCFETYEIAVSGMAVSALIEVGGKNPKVAKAIDKGADYLSKRHPARRVEPGHLYNVWAHSYALEAFARLMEYEGRKNGKTERWKNYRKGAEVEIERLLRYEYVDGGWGYYDFSAQSARPSRGSTSFMSATVLVALKMAEDQGVEIPERLVKGGLRVVEGSRGADDSFAYSYSSPLRPHNPLRVGVSHKKGSLARTPACLLSLDMWGKPVTKARFKKSLDDLEEHGHFLLIARKYPFPHEIWYQNSGYFCFYGYYYAAMVAELLPDADRALASRQLATHLLPLQEPDGCWWDYQLFGYHKTYGTAYVLMALGRCEAGLHLTKTN